MKIPSSELKELSRKLRGVSGELFNFNGLQAYTSVPNLDIVVDFKVDKPFAVSADKFSQIIVRLDGECTMELTTAKLIIMAKRSKLSIPITDPKPVVQMCTTPETCTLECKMLFPALNYALQATQRGSFFNYSGAVALGNYAAGTDGKRMACAKFDGGPSEQIILPVPAVEALKIFEKCPVISIGQNESNLYFHSDGTTLIARRLVKAFPDYEKLIPAKTTYNFTFDNNELKNALKSLKPLAVENQRISLTITDDSAIISLDSEAGSGDVQIPASGGDTFLPYSCQLSYEYLADFVESVTGEIKLGSNTENGPFLLEAGKFKLIIAGSR